MSLYKRSRTLNEEMTSWMQCARRRHLGGGGSGRGLTSAEGETEGAVQAAGR